MLKWSSRRLLAAAVACAAPSAVLGQLRIATYNLDADVSTGVTLNPNTDSVLQAIGAENVNGISRQLDIVGLEETTSNSTTVQTLLNQLNAVYGAGIYSQSTYQATQNGSVIAGNGPNAIIYNTRTVQLINSVGFGTLGSQSTQIPRQEVRYQFRPVGYSSAADFYVYVGHYKAQSDSTSQARRNAEARMVRDNAATLPAGSRILYTGDLNLTNGSAEAAWTTLTSAGEGQAIDPVFGTTAWSNSKSALRGNYSDSTSSLGSRLDFQLNTAPTTDNHGFSLINGSYHVFGNNGTTPLSSSVTYSGNTSVSSTVRTDIANASDHYSVVADYRLPAALGVSVGTLAARVISGANVTLPVTVTNTAPVQYSAGADTLDYSVSSSGSLSGSASASGLAALTTGNMHNLSLNTASVGVATGTISVSTTSQEVAITSFTGSVSTNVLAHAHPSFTTPSQSSSMTINFGTRAANSAAMGLGTPSANFAIRNLVDAAGVGFSSGLDLDSIVGGGDTSALSTTLAPFSTLAANGSNSFSATLNTGSYGSFVATYTLNLSDENLPGAQPTAPLTLTLIGQIAMAGDSNVDGVVNALDFNSLASHFGQSGLTWSDSDFNGDGTVNTTDFTAMSQNFGETYDPNPAPPLAAVVPEPVGLLFVAACSFLTFGRRRSHPLKMGL